jgi:hypothetical protein
LSLGQKLRQARLAEAKAVALADDVALLLRWLREDVLALAGPDHATRRQLYDFIVAEWRARQPLCPHRIKPVCMLLEQQREELLAFAAELDEGLAALGRQFQVQPALVREVLRVQALDQRIRLSSPAPPRSVEMFWTLPPTPVAVPAERSTVTGVV